MRVQNHDNEIKINKNNELKSCAIPAGTPYKPLLKPTEINNPLLLISNNPLVLTMRHQPISPHFHVNKRAFDAFGSTYAVQQK